MSTVSARSRLLEWARPVRAARTGSKEGISWSSIASLAGDVAPLAPGEAGFHINPRSSSACMPDCQSPQTIKPWIQSVQVFMLGSMPASSMFFHISRIEVRSLAAVHPVSIACQCLNVGC